MAELHCHELRALRPIQVIFSQSNFERPRRTVAAFLFSPHPILLCPNPILNHCSKSSVSSSQHLNSPPLPMCEACRNSNRWRKRLSPTPKNSGQELHPSFTGSKSGTPFWNGSSHLRNGFSEARPIFRITAWIAI